MEELLERIATWVSHGTLAQFQTEIDGFLRRSKYRSELRGDELLIYSQRKEGGFLGIGAKTVKDPVMKLARTEAGVEIAREPLDEEFARYLASELRQH